MRSKILMCVSAALLMAMSSCCVAMPEAAYETLMKLGKISREQANELVALPIPDHAKKEIEYGFADEHLVRFINAMRDITPKLTGISEMKYRPVPFINTRYICAVEGLDQLLGQLNNQYPSFVTCLRVWTRFLEEGPELPFKIDFPLTGANAPWRNPSPERLKEASEIAQHFYELYELPKILHEDVVMLKVSHREIHSMLGHMQKYPANTFSDELAAIESQPPEARQFARLICLSHFMPIEVSDSVWGRRCFAYWQRYLETGTD